jgi:hypothetical protein
MGAEILEGAGLWTGETARLLLGQNVDRSVDADGEDILGRLKIGIGAVVQDKWPKAAKIGDDRLAAFRMDADFAGQRQKPKSFFERDVLGLLAFRDRGALRFFSLNSFAELEIGAKASGAAGNLRREQRLPLQRPATSAA